MTNKPELKEAAGIEAIIAWREFKIRTGKICLYSLITMSKRLHVIISFMADLE
jgi:hypothetical protein